LLGAKELGAGVLDGEVVSGLAVGLMLRMLGAGIGELAGEVAVGLVLGADAQAMSSV